MVRILSILFLYLLFSGCGGQSTEHTPTASEDRVILNVEGQTVTAAELDSLLETMRGDSVVIERRVENFAGRLLILHDAIQRGMDTTRAFELYTLDRERDKIRTLWMDWILDLKVSLPRDTVENFYSNMGENVVYTIITVDDRSLCDSLRQLILDGADMNLLAEEHSSNRVEASRKGIVGPVERMLVAPVNSRLMQGLEPGELSQPDSSWKGWSILRIDSLYHYTPPPFDELKNILEARIQTMLQLDYREVLFDSLRTANDLRVQEGIPELLASHFTGSGQAYEPFTPEEENLRAYSFEGGGRTVLELAENISNLPVSTDRDPADPAWIDEYSRMLGLYDIMAMEGRKQGMDTLTEVRDYVIAGTDDHLLDTYYEEVIEPRIVFGEEDIVDLFQARRDSFTIPESRIFRAINAEGEDQLELLDSLLNQGMEPFDHMDVFGPVQVLQAAGEENLTRLIYSPEIPQPYHDIMFGAELGETVTCSLSATRTMALKPVEIYPERLATLEESRSEISDILRTEKEEEAITSLIDSLKSVYHVEIDREYVESFFPAAASPDSIQED